MIPTDENRKFLSDITAESSKERDQYLLVAWGFNRSTAITPLGNDCWRVIVYRQENE